MPKKILILSIQLFILFPSMAQDSVNQSSDNLPYYQIPDYPAEYTANTVAARMVDGLGFRYYWATDGLREEDLAFRPNKEARTSAETIDHILGLTKMILNSVKKLPNVQSGNQPSLTFEEKRKLTLENIKLTSDILKASSADDLRDYNIIFKNGEKTTELPFWNQLNGPIADALWHVGQVVSFRRSSGNPFNGKASVLVGKLRD
jgi:hypothetical protein